MDFLSFFFKGLRDKIILNILLILHDCSITAPELLNNFGMLIHMIDRRIHQKLKLYIKYYFSERGLLFCGVLILLTSENIQQLGNEITILNRVLQYYLITFYMKKEIKIQVKI